MKAIVISILLLSVSQVSFAQSIFDRWQEINYFHNVMSVTFHPAEEDNLDPLKTKSGELMAQAAKLAKSDVPDEFKSDKITEAVKKLEKDSKKLNKMVKSGETTDDQLKQAIYDLHDVFHEIVGLCRGDDH